MPFFVFVWRNIARRKTRSTLTIVGLGVAVAAVVALVGISEGFSTQYNRLYGQRGIDLVVQRVGSGTELNNSLPQSLRSDILNTPHVTMCMEGLMDTPSVSFDKKSLDLVIMNGWPADSALFHDPKQGLKLLQGRYLEPNDKDKVWIGEKLAENLGVKLGDTIKIYDSQKAEVVGIFNSTSVFEQGSIATLLSDMQRYMDRPGEVTGFIVKTDTPKDGTPEHEAELMQTAKRIEKLGDGVAALPTAQFIANVNVIRLAKAVAWVTSAIALFIGAIGMLNTMVMSVFERVREIGTLRAIGWRKFRVMRMILVEALALSLAGAVLGSIAAQLLTTVLSKMPVTSGVISGDVQPVIFVEGFLLALLVGLAGALYPAYWGANLRPVEALRRKA